MNKKYISTFLIAVFAFTYLYTATGKTAFGVVSTGPYTGEYLVAINNNTNLELGVQSTGTINSLDTKPSFSNNGENEFLEDMPIDYTPEQLPIVQNFNGKDNNFQLEKPAASYAQNDIKNIYVTNVSTNQMESITVKLRNQTTYYDIWVQEKDSTGKRVTVNFTDAQLTQYGNTLDQKMHPCMSDNYGNTHDLDGSGRLSIVLTDIVDGYTPGSSYIAGYFSPNDFIYKYQLSPEYRNHTNEWDAIYMDTYPGMINNNDINSINLNRSLGTMAHELQHNINYSYRFIKNTSGQAKGMDVWLNEALAESASYMYELYDTGIEPTQSSRINYYNSSSFSNYFKNGISLYNWQGELSNYSMSFLFSQYIRTQTKHLAEGGGKIFRRILETAESSGKLALETAFSEIGIQTTLDELNKNFRIALIAKQPDGVYGFMGEPLFNNLTTHIFSGTEASLVSGGSVVVPINTPLGVNKPINCGENILFFGVGEQPINYPTLDLNRTTHDKNTATDGIRGTLDLSTYTFNAIANETYNLIENVDYTYEGSTVEISKEYLNSMPKGTINLTFKFSQDYTIEQSIEISDSTVGTRYSQPNVTTIERSPNTNNVTITLGSNVGTNSYDVEINGVVRTLAASGTTLSLNNYITKAGDYYIRVYAKTDGSTLQSFPSFVYTFENQAVATKKATESDLVNMTASEKEKYGSYILKDEYSIPPNATSEEQKKYLPTKMAVKLDIPLEDGSMYTLIPVDFTNYTQ